MFVCICKFIFCIYRFYTAVFFLKRILDVQLHISDMISHNCPFL